MAEIGNLRITIGLNTAQVTEGIKTINSRLNALNSEFRAVSSGALKFDNSLDSLRSKSDVLTRSMQVHQRKVEELRQKYEQSKATKGEDAAETLKLATAYNKAVAAMNNTEHQLKSVNQQIDSQTNSFRQLERQVNTNVDRMSRELRVLESSFSTTGNGMDHMNHSTHELHQRQNELNQSIEIQQRRLRELQNLLQATGNEMGRDSREAQEMQIRFNQASQALNRTQTELRQTEQQLQTQSSAWGRLGQALAMNHSQLGIMGMNLQMAGMNIGMALTPAVIALGGGLTVTAKKAMDFESQMSAVKSVMSPDEVEKYGKALQGLAETMGEKTKYSSVEAAQGIEELIKAGVKVTDIIHGGLDGALALATAGELELADAAGIASTALNAFQKDNLTVMQAADLLAGAANASATSVSEMRYGLAMVSAVASGVGLSFKDTTTALAEFSQNGLRGSDAGTSLKTMLLNLTPSSEEASEAMVELGLQTKKGASLFYDANGHIKSMAEIAELLKTKLAKLTDEQRQLALKTMFGTDAIRAANILYKDGAAGINNMAAAMTKIKAADVAAVRLDNVKGSIQKLKGTVETTAISFGNTMLPTIEKVTASLKKATKGFNELSPEMKQLIVGTGVAATAITGLTVAFGGTLAIVGGAISGFSAISTAITALAGGTGILGAAFGALTGPVGLTVAGLGLATVAAIGLTQAYKDNNEISFKALQARQKEIESNDKLIKNFDTLRIKNQLSNEQMMRFLDIQDEIASTSTPERIAALKDEQAKLLEKSGLTNKEMQNFLEYNEQIIDKAPATEKAISLQGNAFAKNADALRNVNAEKLKSLKIDAERTMIDSLEKENSMLAEKRNLIEQINKKEQETEKVTDNIAAMNKEILDRERELKVLQSDKSVQGVVRARDAEAQLLNLKESLATEKQILKGVLATLESKKEQLTATEKELKVLDQNKFKYEQIVMAQVGLTSERGKGLELLETEIAKLEKARAELKEMHSKGQLNTAEYNDQVAAIDAQIGKLQGAKGELVDINTIAGKTVYKSVIIDDQARKDAEDLNELLAKKITKDVYINTPRGFGRNVQEYAKGTRYAPGGLSWVGERGRELTFLPRGGFALVSEPSLLNLPRGARVIPNRDTERILRSWNIPKLANGGVTIDEGWAIAGERGQEIVDLRGAATSPFSGNYDTEKPFNINIAPAPVNIDGHQLGEIIYKVVDELIQFDNNRRKRF